MFQSIIVLATLIALGAAGCKDEIIVKVLDYWFNAEQLPDAEYLLENHAINVYKLDFNATVLNDIPANTRVKACLKVQSAIPMPPLCYDVDLRKLLLQDKYIADTAVKCSNIKKAVPFPKGVYKGRDCMISIEQFVFLVPKASDFTLHITEDTGALLKFNLSVIKRSKCG